MPHFQLRLKRLYQRTIISPWRKNILYVGDPIFYPENYSQKCFIHLKEKCERSEKTIEGAFDIYTDTPDLPLADESIDIVICQLQEISFNREQLLKEFHRALNQNGKLLITIQNAWSPYYFLQTQKDRPKISSLELNHLLEKYHFEIIKSFPCSFIKKNQSEFTRAISLKIEPFLSKWCGSFANQYSVLAVKKGEIYQPLPPYLRISKTIPYLGGLRTEETI